MFLNLEKANIMWEKQINQILELNRILIQRGLNGLKPIGLSLLKN